jgi:hypothetical protein
MAIVKRASRVIVLGAVAAVVACPPGNGRADCPYGWRRPYPAGMHTL